MARKLTKAQLAKIAEIIDVFEEENLSEITVEENGLYVELKGPAAVHAPAGAAPSAGSPAAGGGRVRAEHWHDVLAPMTGVFYRAADPEGPPYIEVGALVSVGETIGLIEAMKVFSEIPAPISGRIVEIAVGNGSLVGEGDLLMVIDPGG
jgi:acetyl-CoA carboxylase biotin carboxyl carrier protein